MNDSYQAWWWHDGAGPQALTQETRPLPVPAPGEILVHNRAIGLNPVDWKVLDSQRGKVPGVDGAGVVIAVGTGVSEHWLGQRVAYHQSLKRHGSFASHTPLAASAAMRIPAGLDNIRAAAFPCPGLTAWQALEKIPARPGERILISGAGGSVGHWLTQLAHRRGFIIEVMCNTRHRERLQELGASAWHPGPLVNDAPFPEALHHRYFAVFDAVNGEHSLRLGDALRANGHLISIQDRSTDWPCPPFGRALSLHEVALGALHFHGDDHDWQQLTRQGERLLEALADGTLHGESILVHDFASLPEQLEALKQRSFSGKLVINL
jgi:NADPH2:quinone reductase